MNTKGKQWRFLTTFISLAPVAVFAFMQFDVGGKLLPAWQVIWPAFGTTNQLLAALALLVVVVWRRAEGKSIWFVFAPMVFMMVTTVTSMFILINTHLLSEGGNRAIGAITCVMLLMTAALVVDTILNWTKLEGKGVVGGKAVGTME